MAETGDTDAARKIYEERAASGDALAHRNLGLLLESFDSDRAQEHYRAAASLGDVRSLFLLGELVERMGRVGDSRDLYERAIDLGDVEGLLALGLLEQRVGNIRAAEAAFRHAIAEGYGHRAYSMLGRLLSTTGRDVEAEQLYEGALADGETDVILNLANLLAEKPDEASLRRAEDLYRRAISAGETEAYNNLGTLLAELGRTDEAITAFRQGASVGDELARQNLERMRIRKSIES